MYRCCTTDPRGYGPRTNQAIGTGSSRIGTVAFQPPADQLGVRRLSTERSAAQLTELTKLWAEARVGVFIQATYPLEQAARRKELAVGPLKSTASNAILTLPPFAVQALRQHRLKQARLRLACGQPQTVSLRWVEPGRPPQPVQLDLVFRTERGTPVNPNHASRAFARLAASVGLAAHPHLLRHALASAWRLRGNRPVSSPRSCATPTVERSPSACTSTSSRR